MISSERRHSFLARLEHIAGACDFVEDAAFDAGFDVRSAYHCRLAVDEACTNIIEHGFAEDDHDHTIDVVCHCSDVDFVITIRDDAPPFDPTTVPAPPPIHDIDALKPGGWGIHLIRKMMDDVRYERANDHNILTITKHLPQPAAADREAPSILLPMPIHVSLPHPKVALIAPTGRIDQESQAQVERVLIEQLSEGRKALVLFMNGVDYLSSGGMKMLVSAWQRTRDAKSDLILCSVTPRVRETLHIVGLDLVFVIVPTVEDALNAVKFRT
jgi:anti-anti-sigma factor